MRDLKLSKRKAGRNGRTLLRAQLNTTTLPLVDSLSPRRRSGERVRERGFQLANSIEGAPLPSPLPARASRGEGAGWSNGGGIQMRQDPPSGLYFD